MTTLLIIGTLCLIVGTTNLIKVKTRARIYRAANRGSRAVELDEWDKWSGLLLKEYNQLTGFELPYPEIKLTSDSFDRAYYVAFSEPYEFENNKWKDSNALEILRAKYNLPSDDEIYTLQEWMYKKKILKRPTFYTCLAYIINQCVYRAVHERGYKYGGKDWEGQNAVRLKWEEIQNNHKWLKNDPTNR